MRIKTSSLMRKLDTVEAIRLKNSPSPISWIAMRIFATMLVAPIIRLMPAIKPRTRINPVRM